MHLLEPDTAGEPRRLQTEGINFQGVWEQQKLLDVDQIACNDVHAMLTTYGVEAARATILKEVQVCLLGVHQCLSSPLLMVLICILTLAKLLGRLASLCASLFTHGLC